MINICICFDNNYFNFALNLIKSILDTYILVDKGHKHKR